MGVRQRPSARCGSSAREASLGQRVAGGGIAHDARPRGRAAPAPALRSQHVAEEPADRRAQAMQDAIALRAQAPAPRAQSQRS